MRTTITAKIIIKSVNRHRQFSSIMAGGCVRAAIGGITGYHVGHEGQSVYFHVEKVEMIAPATKPSFAAARRRLGLPKNKKST